MDKNKIIRQGVLSFLQAMLFLACLAVFSWIFSFATGIAYYKCTWITVFSLVIAIFALAIFRKDEDGEGS